MNTSKEHTKFYGQEEQILEINEYAKQGLQIKMLVSFETPKFLEYQKDLMQDFVANFIDDIKNNDYEVSEIKNNFELGLQDLNTKLKLFADKVRDVDFFEIKGYIQLISDNVLVSSMIGDVTIMIFRDSKLYYTLHNTNTNKGKSDLFSEFIEGDLENGDELVYVGTKVSDILDNSDIRELEKVLENEETSLIKFFHDLLTARIEKQKLSFININDVGGIHMIRHHHHNKISLGMFKNLGNMPFIHDLKNRFLKNKYQVTVLILSIFIAFMFYNLLAQIFSTKNQEVYVNSDGVTVDLTIDDIKKDIALFKSMDPTGNEKGVKYQEILSKLDTLQKKGRRLDDLTQLKKILKADYYKGFNIITINDLKQFDDNLAGRKTTIFSFNAAEKAKIGDLLKIDYQKDIMIGGTKAALLGMLNDNMRGALVEYGEDGIEGCSMNLLKNGFYCYTAAGKIILVTNAGIESVTTGDPEGFPMNIGGIGTYGKANIYVFNKNLTSLSNSTLVTRYRNTLGSQSIYQAGQKYMIATSLATGMDFGASGFSSFTIDSTFLGWANGKLYQFRRDPPTSVSLQYREIKLLGGDNMTSKYSNNVKVITPASSKYVYLFDKDNQSLTIYDSRPVKTNAEFQTSYNLYYMFRFGFDLGANKVTDITIPDTTGNRPEMYILTTNGVNKINLYEFIDSIKDNQVLKQLPTN